MIHHAEAGKREQQDTYVKERNQILTCMKLLLQTYVTLNLSTKEESQQQQQQLAMYVPYRYRTHRTYRIEKFLFLFLLLSYYLINYYEIII